MAGIYAGDNPYVLANPAMRMWESIDYMLNMLDFDSYLMAEDELLDEGQKEWRWKDKAAERVFHAERPGVARPSVPLSQRLKDYEERKAQGKLKKGEEAPKPEGPEAARKGNAKLLDLPKQPGRLWNWHHAIKTMATSEPGSDAWKRGAAHIVKHHLSQKLGKIRAGSEAGSALRDQHAHELNNLFQPDGESGHPPIHRIAKTLHDKIQGGGDVTPDDLHKMVNHQRSIGRRRAYQKAETEKKHIGGSLSGGSKDDNEKDTSPSDDRELKGSERGGKMTPPHSTAKTTHDHWLRKHPYVIQHLGKEVADDSDQVDKGDDGEETGKKDPKKTTAGVPKDRHGILNKMYDKHRQSMGHKEAVAHIVKGLGGDVSKSEVEDHISGAKPKKIKLGGGPRLAPMGGKLRMGAPAKTLFPDKDEDREKAAKKEVRGAFRQAIASGVKKIRKLKPEDMSRSKTGILVPGGDEDEGGKKSKKVKPDAEVVQAARKTGANLMRRLGHGMMAAAKQKDAPASKDKKGKEDANPVTRFLTKAKQDPETRMTLGHSPAPPDEPTPEQAKKAKEKGETPEQTKKRLAVQHHANVATSFKNFLGQTGIKPGEEGPERLDRAGEELLRAKGKKFTGMGGDPAERSKPKQKKSGGVVSLKDFKPKKIKVKGREAAIADLKEKDRAQRMAQRKAKRAGAAPGAQPAAGPAARAQELVQRRKERLQREANPIAKLKSAQERTRQAELARQAAARARRPANPNELTPSERAAPRKPEPPRDEPRKPVVGEFKKNRIPYSARRGQGSAVPAGIGQAKPRFDKPAEESLAVRCGLMESRRVSLAERVLR